MRAILQTRHGHNVRMVISCDIFDSMHSRGYYVGYLFRISANGARSSIFIKVIREHAMKMINDHVYVQIKLHFTIPSSNDKCFHCASRLLHSQHSQWYVHLDFINTMHSIVCTRITFWFCTSAIITKITQYCINRWRKTFDWICTPIFWFWCMFHKAFSVKYVLNWLYMFLYCFGNHFR